VVFVWLVDDALQAHGLLDDRVVDEQLGLSRVQIGSHSAIPSAGAGFQFIDRRVE